MAVQSPNTPYPNSPCHIDYQAIREKFESGAQRAIPSNVLSVTYYPKTKMIVSITTEGNALFVPNNHRYSVAETVAVRDLERDSDVTRCRVTSLPEKTFNDLVKRMHAADKNAAEARKDKETAPLQKAAGKASNASIAKHTESIVQPTAELTKKKK